MDNATRPRSIYVGTGVRAPSIEATTGVKVAGSAPSGHYLKGNGTYYVDGMLQSGATSTNSSTASIATSNLAASAVAGEYSINVYLAATTTCSSPGSGGVTVTIGWTDDLGTKTMLVPLSGTGSSGNSMAFNSSAGNFGQGAITIWNNATANITYATTYTACTTGTGTYSIRLSAVQVQ